jgi:hypothetical protein
MRLKEKSFLLDKIEELKIMKTNIQPSDEVSKIQLEQLIEDFKTMLNELENNI